MSCLNELSFYCVKWKGRKRRERLLNEGTLKSQNHKKGSLVSPEKNGAIMLQQYRPKGCVEGIEVKLRTCGDVKPLICYLGLNRSIKFLELLP